MTDTLKPNGLHLHWPSLVHEHLAGEEDHAHVIKGGCRNAPGIETILLGDEIPEGQNGKFFAACPIHGAMIDVS